MPTDVRPRFRSSSKESAAHPERQTRDIRESTSPSSHTAKDSYYPYSSHAGDEYFSDYFSPDVDERVPHDSTSVAGDVVSDLLEEDIPCPSCKHTSSHFKLFVDKGSSSSIKGTKKAEIRP